MAVVIAKKPTIKEFVDQYIDFFHKTFETLIVFSNEEDTFPLEDYEQREKDLIDTLLLTEQYSVLQWWRIIGVSQQQGGFCRTELLIQQLRRITGLSATIETYSYNFDGLTHDQVVIILRG